MDATHLHLLLTHVPIVGTILGGLILLYGFFSKNESLIKVALLTFIAMALITILVYFSGELASDVVKNIAGISEKYIEKHETIANKSVWFMGILGILSILNLFAIYKKQSLTKILTLLTLVFAFITFGFFVKAGNSGGQIRHTEIRPSLSKVKQAPDTYNDSRDN